MVDQGRARPPDDAERKREIAQLTSEIAEIEEHIKICGEIENWAWDEIQETLAAKRRRIRELEQR